MKMGKGKMLPMVILGIVSGVAAGSAAVYYAVSKKYADANKGKAITEAEAATAEALFIDEIKKADEISNLVYDKSEQISEGNTISIEELLNDDSENA